MSICHLSIIPQRVLFALNVFSLHFIPMQKLPSKYAGCRVTRFFRLTLILFSTILIYNLQLFYRPYLKLIFLKIKKNGKLLKFWIFSWLIGDLRLFLETYSVDRPFPGQKKKAWTLQRARIRTFCNTKDQWHILCPLGPQISKIDFLNVVTC